MINNEKYKTCNICGLIKNHDDFYNKDTRCKDCKCEYQKKRRLINKDKKTELKKKEDLRDKVLSNMCNYYENKIEILEKEIKNLHIKLKVKDHDVYS
jgi:hypothetical protein